MIEVSGVRSSWLMVARKSLFIWSTCSSSSFASFSSTVKRTFLTAMASWVVRPGSRATSARLKRCWGGLSR